MSITFDGFWTDTDRIENKCQPLKVMIEATSYSYGESEPTYRDATDADLFKAGYTTQYLALEEIKKRNKEIKAVKTRNAEILHILRDLVKSIKDAQDEGFTFEEFSNPEGVQDALEQAEELLVEEDMDI